MNMFTSRTCRAPGGMLPLGRTHAPAVLHTAKKAVRDLVAIDIVLHRYTSQADGDNAVPARSATYDNPS